MQSTSNDSSQLLTVYSLDYLNLQLSEERLSQGLSSLQLSTIEHLLQLLNCQNSLIDIEQLKHWSDKGIPDQCYGMRALVWKIHLGYLSPDKRKWMSTLAGRRASYNQFLDDFFGKSEVPPQSIIDEYELSELKRIEDSIQNMHSEGSGSTATSSTSATSIDSIQDTRDNVEQKDSLHGWSSYFNDSEQFCQIEKDTDRTRTEVDFFSSPTNRHLRVGIPFQTYARNLRKKRMVEQSERHCEVLSRILYIYSKLNVAVQYVQGMNEILAPIYFAFYQESKCNPLFAEDGFIQVEADAFFCFVNLMAILKDRFMRQMDEFPTGLRHKCIEFQSYFRIYDQRLCTHFDNLAIDPQFYSLRWLLLLFSQEFSLEKVMRLWDTLFTRDDLLTYLNYFGLAILKIKRDDFKDPDFAVVMTKLQRLESMDVGDIIQLAGKISDEFRELQKQQQQSQQQ